MPLVAKRLSGSNDSFIAHDDPKRWKTEYAEVYRKDPVLCAYCHDEPFEPRAEH